MNDRVIDEGHALLGIAVPAPRVVLIGIVELRIRTEGRKKRGLVVRRPAQPAIADPRPFGDRVAPGDLLLDIGRRLEVALREATPLGGTGQDILAAVVILVQRVVEARHHPRGVLEGRMLGDLADPLAVDPDLAAVVETVQELLARIGQGGGLRRRRAFGGGCLLGHRCPPS